ARGRADRRASMSPVPGRGARRSTAGESVARRAGTPSGIAAGRGQRFARPARLKPGAVSPRMSRRRVHRSLYSPVSHNRCRTWRHAHIEQEIRAVHPRRPSWWPGFVLLCGLAATTPAAAQQAPVTLSLEEAIDLARRNNPDFLIQKNDESEADWAVREAYGGLLPYASIGGGIGYDAAGEQRLGVFASSDLGIGRTPAYLSSSYGLTVGYRLNGDVLFRPRQERANRNATRARIEAAEFNLKAEITRRYLAAVRARDGVELARRELERATENLRLAEARVAVGAAISLDAKQAE